MTVFWIHFLIQFLRCFMSVLLFIFNYLFCYFLFHCFIMLVLIALSKVFCVMISHLFWSWVTSLLTLDYFYIISFYLILYMAPTCPKSASIHILRCDLCCFYGPLLTLNDAMSYYCLSHYFNDISMLTVF